MANMSLSEIKKKLTPEELVEFNEWLVGQTVPVLDTGEHGVYEHDFRRWLRWKREGAPEPIWD